jgi:hypothetical protein
MFGNENRNRHMSQELIDLITCHIPVPPPRQYGIMDVVDCATHENTISSVYRYFLDQERSPLLSVVMMDALMELVNQKSAALDRPIRNMDFSHYKVYREATTVSQKRIDLLIISRVSKSAIIIEVKVHAPLYNNLWEYWKHSKYADENKVAIVLSLEYMNPKNFTCPHFICITHAEWLKRVITKGLPDEMPINEIIYFKDFTANMNRLTRQMEMNNSVKFYIEHSDSITKAIATKNAATDYVMCHLRKVAEDMNFEYDHSRRDTSWTHLKAKVHGGKQVWYWIKPDAIVNSLPKVSIVIEMSNKNESHRSSMHTLLNGEQFAFVASAPELLITGGQHTSHICRMTYQFDPNGSDSLSEMLSKAFGELEKVRVKLVEVINKPTVEEGIVEGLPSIEITSDITKIDKWPS